MANNVFKPRGATSASKPDSGGAVLRSVPVFGVVKDNIDPIRSGRLRVYISDFGGQDPDDAESWITVNYMTPFYGLTQGDSPKEGYGTYLQNQSSYGMWYSPPDIGTTVVCLFINGDPEYGYWIGCVPEPEALYTVPALGAAETVIVNENEGKSYGGATKLPVANINKNNQAINESATFFNEPKPVHSYLAGVLNQQGLLRDTIRGTIGTSAQRETPSRVGWGVNTPGRPIYEGGFTDETIADATSQGGQQSSLKVIARRAGHSFVMDDGDLIGRDQLIRLRSSLGHQILMSDDGQTIHIIHANGQSWVELGKEGTIDMYATNSVNIRTQGDLNLHADNNINMHAKKDLNIYAENITTNSDKKTNIKVGTDYAESVTGKKTVKVNGAMSLASSGEASFSSSNLTYINGRKVNLNTGQTSTVPQELQPIPLNAHTDTLYDSVKGWAGAPGALISITSRAPAHAPWANANQGVDVKVNNDADANFPKNPAPAVLASNNAATTPSTPVSQSVAATVPVPSAVSAALDKNTTGAMVGQVATIAQTVPNVAEAIKGGAGVVTNTVNGVVQKVAVVGKMAQTPQQMEAAGVLKVGSAALVNNLVQVGKSLGQALTPNLFTGKPGAENLTNYINNVGAQVQTQVSNFQQAQTQLTQAGIITGKESPGQLAGIVTAGAAAGVQSTVNAIKSASGTIGQTITGSINSLTGPANSLLGSAQSLINSGNFAGNLASSVTGGLSSLASSLNGLVNSISGGAQGLLNSAKGIAGSAFAAIKNTFPNLTAGTPQNLKKIAEEAYAKAQNVGTTLQAGTTQPIQVGLGNVAQTLTSGASSLLPSSISTGLSALPGAGKAVSSVVNNAKGALNTIPGTANISASLDQIKGAISAGTAITGAAGQLVDKLKAPGESLKALASSGLPAGAAAELNSAISSLSSGGSVPIKLPVVSVNTVDRTSITNQISAVFGNPKIPIPNYSGNPASVGPTAGTTALGAANQKATEIGELLKEIDQLADTRFDLVKSERNAVQAYNDAKVTLPAGDPGIEAALSELKTAKNAVSDLDVKIVALREKVSKLSSTTA